MQLNFVIDAAYFIAHTLAGMQSFSSDDDGRADVVAFQNYAWSVSSELYNVLAQPVPAEQHIVDHGSIRAYWEDFDWSGLDEYVATLQRSKEYKKILKQAQDYLSFCRNQWERNYPAASKIIHDVTGLSLADQFTIYITHPCQRNGIPYGNHKIGWGHHEDWPNYTTVYLWHEILHSYLGVGDVEHAVIQLIADEELRTMLNGGSYPPFVGHEYLAPISAEMLPAWKDYLKQDRRDIHQFVLRAKNALQSKGHPNN